MKTIEEEAKEQANALRIYSSKQDFEKGFKAGVEFAQRWIPVEEEFPEIGKEVLVKVNDLTCSNHPNGVLMLDYVVSISHNKKGFRCEVDYSGKTRENVTHWRPIELK